MRYLQRVFIVGYSIITLFFLICGFALIVFAGYEMWLAVRPAEGATVRDRFNAILEGIGLLTIAVASLELGQTIIEEEVLRQEHMSTPTRVRRFLSRFMIVIVVSLSIEFLVAVFQLIHENPALIPQASAIGITAALLLAAWGLFIRLNKSAEEIEPEAMEKTKQEDRKMKG